VHLDALAAAGIGQFQRNAQLGAGVALRRRTAAPAEAAATEQRFEEVAEAAAAEIVLEAEALAVEAEAAEIRRRPELLARPVAAGARLGVGAPLRRGGQHRVGRADGLAA